MQAVAIPIVLDLVVQALHVLLRVGGAVADADLVGLLLRTEDPLLLVLQVLTDAGLIVEHRLVLAVVCCHLLGGAGHVANGNAARSDRVDSSLVARPSSSVTYACCQSDSWRRRPPVPLSTRR